MLCRRKRSRGKIRFRVRSYLIDARVKPPKEVDGDVTLQLDVVRGGSRFLVFELSRFLQVHTVEADGRLWNSFITPRWKARGSHAAPTIWWL